MRAFIGSVAAVILAVTLPRVRHAALVVALELRRAASYVHAADFV